ncbi:FAD/NAD-P-binding domain-containing protein [Amylostereum chailletii]|nr:FAD/NAD-P-binding domain-containing protein [Amylostereum chailletii]
MLSKFSGWTWRKNGSERSKTPPSPPKDTDSTIRQPYKAGDFSVDDWRPMKVICIGAGYSGITSAIRFRQRVPNLELKIYEKAEGIGGTWYSNKYPGVACDLPSLCYQLTFEEQAHWSGFYSPGPEILANMERIVDKYKIRKYIHLQHELTHARWDEDSSKWVVRIHRGGDQGEDFEDTCDILFLCIGSLDRWHWPDIEGLREFGGKLVHSAQWDVTDGAWENGVKHWGDKNVGVIGNGSSGIQTVAALHPKVKTLINYARRETWIASAILGEQLTRLLGREPGDTNMSFTEDERKLFSDPEKFRKFRHALEGELNSLHSLSIRGSELQKATKAAFEEDMKQKMASKPGLAEKMTPKWSVFCRRLTPGPGYIEALCQPNSTFETTPIKRVTRTGVELVDGRHNDLDVLVCATGFDVTYHYPFDVIGRGGQKLNDRWTPYAEAYISMAVDGFPNLFFAYGPNSGVNSGSIIVIIEKQVDYAIAATLKLQRERLKSMEVKKEATRDWVEHMRDYFPKTVYSDECHSWYKVQDGTVVGLWPGSSLHCIRTLSNPRWEDYNYEPFDNTHNRLYWLGTGQTENERTLSGDRAWYLNNVDVPPIPETD